MKLLDRLQRRLGRLAVPHLTEALIGCQVAVYVILLGRPDFLDAIVLVPRLVLEGQYWRPLSFVCQPPPMNPLFAFFFWYLFLLMGTALENTWGAFRYNVYLAVGWAATVAAAFLAPERPASVVFLQGSVFLAFAYLYPDFKLLLFFLIPVKVKYLALVQWFFYAWLMIEGDLIMQVLTTAAVANFALFFWHDIYLRMRSGGKRMARQAEQIRAASTPRHCCAVCGATNLSHPRMSFRYCSRCTGAPCYCEEHLHNHEHVVRDATAHA